jgi:hypothetical protein
MLYYNEKEKGMINNRTNVTWKQSYTHNFNRMLLITQKCEMENITMICIIVLIPSSQHKSLKKYKLSMNTNCR